MTDRNETAEMLLVGKVGDDIKAIDVDRALIKIGDRPIHVLLKSSGGDFNAAFSIYTRFREVAKDQELKITAVDAHSAAVLILLGSDTRTVAANGLVMIHPLRTGIDYGMTPTQLRERATSIEAMTCLVTQVMRERTGQTREALESIWEEYLQPQRALEMGFATAIGPEFF